MDWEQELMNEIEDISGKKKSEPFKVFLWWYLKNTLDIPDEKLDELINVDKARDGSCDAVYIDHTTHLIKIYQSKYTANIGASPYNKDDLLKLIKVLDYLKSNGEYDKFRAYINETLKHQLDRAKNQVDYGYEVKLFFITNHKKNDNANIYNNLPENQLEIVSLGDLRRKLEQWKHNHYPELDNLIFKYESIFEGPKNPRAYILTIKTNELRKYYLKYKEDLFSRNVRIFQKGTKPNKAIKETLEKSPENFWYYHNGITILTEKIINEPKNEDKKIEIKNPQIINGCQTVTVIGENKQTDSEVIVRIIEADDLSSQTFIDKIIEANNRQNPINERTLKSTHPLQVGLYKQLESDFGYYYETKKNSYQAERKKYKYLSKLNRIKNIELVQANLAIVDEPRHSIKDKEDVLFSDRFDLVFKKNKSVLDYLIPYLIYKKIYLIGNKCKQSKRKRFNKYCSFYILRIIYDFNKTLNDKFKLFEVYKKLNEGNLLQDPRVINKLFGLFYDKFKKSDKFNEDSGSRDFLSKKENYDIFKKMINNSLKVQIKKGL